MCDYSLESYVSRSAKVGERLRTYTFPSLSAGMVGTYEGSPTLLAQAMRMLKAIGGDWDFGCAVCLQPGTELMFSKPIEFSHCRTAWGSHHTAAKFVQLECVGGPALIYLIDGREVRERDAIELPDGSRYLFRDLAPAQICTVVQLPRAADEHDVKARIDDDISALRAGITMDRAFISRMTDVVDELEQAR